MKLILLGGEGFIGSATRDELKKFNYDIRTIDIKKSADYVLDIKNSNDLYDVLAEFEPNIVVNFAAKVGGIKYFHKYPADLLVENELILCSVFPVLVSLDIPIVQISSSMVFEQAKIFPSREEHVEQIPCPLSSYGFQKRMSEIFCKAFYKQYGLKYIIIRPFNAVGIGEFPSDEAHVIPIFIERALNHEKPFKILGDGNQIRCFTNVKDIARGIRLAIEKRAWLEDFNIASEENIKIIDLASKIWYKCNSSKFKPFFLPKLEWDVFKRIPSVSKAKNILDFTADISLDESLDEIIPWLNKR